MGRKPGASRVLEYMLERGITIKLVVAPENDSYPVKLKDTARLHNIPVFFDDKKVYELIAKDDPLVQNIDLVISFLFWNKIRFPLITLGKAGCINFHPAPLPDYKSRAGYNTAFLDKRKTFGVSAHFIDSEKFDCGPIIKVLEFPFNHETDNAHSLEKITQEKLFELFTKVIEQFYAGGEITTTPNHGGLYLTLKQLEALKAIDPEKNSLEDINRKIRAFFFPPYMGANITIRGQRFTLLNDEILKYIHDVFQEK